MSTENDRLESLDAFTDRKIGRVGGKKREAFDTAYRNFKLGVLIQQARKKKGLTQEQLAMRSGTNKSYISKVERDAKDIRFSTLQRIIHEGLEGALEIQIRL